MKDIEDLGKKVSLGAKALGGLFVLVMVPLNAIFHWEYGMWDIVFAGAYFAGLGLPIDFSKIITKFRPTGG